MKIQNNIENSHVVFAAISLLQDESDMTRTLKINNVSNRII